MYFVLSINSRTNSGKIVEHAKTLEDAIALVTKCARDYVLTKSEPLLHRKEERNDDNTETRFFSSNSTAAVHQIDVFKQKIDIVKGWLGTTQVSHSPKLVRRFMYCSYNIDSSSMPPVPPPPPPVLPQSQIVIKRTPKIMPTGGFPSNVLESLIENTQFQRHRHTTDNNKLNGMFTETDDETE
jgi:hypothetical protein